MLRFSAFVGLDVHKNSISVAVARAGEEPARCLSRLPNDYPRLRKLLETLGEPSTISVCYEAGPTGYGLVRRLREEGFACEVVAPAKTPKISSNRVKTDRRDAIQLADFLRSGHLTFLRVPTPEEEALRDLIRAREDLKSVQLDTQRQLISMLLRHGRIWTMKSHWTVAHLQWVSRQTFDHPASTEAHAHYLGEVLRLREAVAQLDRRIEEVATTLERSDLVQALCALKGIKTLSAATLVSEVGELRRFPTARRFMSFLGLTPSESSSGDTRHRGPITKAGNRRLRRLLVEAAWAYYRSPHVSKELQRRSRGTSTVVRQIAWRAQKRLHRRLYSLTRRGTSPRKALVAVARELAGFVWAIGQEDVLIEPTT